jgi:ADP-heptose:LPS heptosyltransferase
LKTFSSPILIIHQGALGDLMMSLPALYSLRIFYEGIPWTMAGNKETLSLLHHRFYAQEIISIHQKEWAWLFQEEKELPDQFRRWLSSFQKVILFSSRPQEMLIRGLKQAGLKKVIWIPSRPDAERGQTLPTLQQEILKSENIPWLVPEKAIFPGPEDLRKAREYLHTNFGLEERRPLWAVHPGSGSPHKNWPMERFFETAGELRDRGRFQPIFLLGPVEEETDTIVIPAIQTQAFPIIRNLTLPVLAALLTLCGGYLGNDSGVSHLAAAVGIPTLSIFGPTDPFLWASRGKAVKVLAPSLPCAPCTREKMASCPLQECLESISVSQVVEAVEALTS